jgi:hypothetical protein
MNMMDNRIIPLPSRSETLFLSGERKMIVLLLLTYYEHMLIMRSRKDNYGTAKTLQMRRIIALKDVFQASRRSALLIARSDADGG